MNCHMLKLLTVACRLRSHGQSLRAEAGHCGEATTRPDPAAGSTSEGRVTCRCFHERRH